MPALLVVAPDSLSGKTTVAVALGGKLRDAGRSVALARLAGDAHAEGDAALFATLPINGRKQPGPIEPGAAIAGVDVAIVEAPAGDPREAATSVGGRALVALAYSDPLPADVSSYCQALGESCAGIVITRVPARRSEATRLAAQEVGVPVLGLLSEDRTLASPTLGAVAQALEAEATFLNSARDRVIDRPLISSISADPAQGYFVRYNPDVVIVRGDKPDQQLGALNAGAPCLIVTGGLAVLSYVEDRAREEEVPILRTSLDTASAVEKLEELYAATPFSGQAKVERVAQLAEIDVSSLV